MNNTYEEVASECKLSPGQATRYVTYMRTRWPGEESLHCQVGYAQEWAERFYYGIEFNASDSTGQHVLRVCCGA